MSFYRSFCSSEFSGWIEEVEYLDEFGSVIYSGKGIRFVELGVDDYVMVGGLKKFLMNVFVVVKIVEVV